MGLKQAVAWAWTLCHGKRDMAANAWSGHRNWVNQPGRLDAPTGAQGRTRPQGYLAAGAGNLQPMEGGGRDVRGERQAPQRNYESEQRDDGARSVNTGSGSVARHRLTGWAVWFSWLRRIRREQDLATRETRTALLKAQESGREIDRQSRDSSDIVYRLSELLERHT